jgi:hypothetical protein
MSTTTLGAPAMDIPAESFDLARHNGLITISNPATGNHRTFKISTCRHGSLKGKRIVSLLIGANNDGDESTGDYLGFGFVDTAKCDGQTYARVNVWSKHRGPTADGKPSEFVAFARMLFDPAAYMARGVRYQISGTCRRCNRTLTVPGSITDGLGPECAKKAAEGL